MKSNLPSFSQAAFSVEVSEIKQLELLAKAHKGTISLAQGIPSFDTPDHIKEAAKDAIDRNIVGKYTAGYGIDPLREAIAKKVTSENGIPTKSTEVIVTHGATEAFMAIALTLLDTNDQLAIITPDWTSHLSHVLIATGGRGLIQVPLKETEDDWVFDPQRLEKAITPKTKALLICNPNNPLGKVYSRDELKEIARIAIEHDLFILTDEMYEHFTFDDNKHVSIGSFPEVADRTISVFGVSKSYAMTGWRIGYIVAKQNIIDQILKIHDSIVTAPTSVSQYAALAAISGPQNIVTEYKNAFLNRRGIVMDELAKTDKLKLIKPQGAYYAFPKITVKVDDKKLAVELVKKARVAVVAGSAFGAGGENHIRISFGLEEEMLKEGLRRLVSYLNTKL